MHAVWLAAVVALIWNGDIISHHRHSWLRRVGVKVQETVVMTTDEVEGVARLASDNSDRLGEHETSLGGGGGGGGG